MTTEMKLKEENWTLILRPQRSWWDLRLNELWQYRDLQQLVGFGVQLLMYATPVIYPISSLKGNWQWLVIANPMTAVVEVFRLAFLGVSSLSPVYLLYSLGFTAVILVLGVLIFNRVEATFMDTV